MGARTIAVAELKQNQVVSNNDSAAFNWLDKSVIGTKQGKGQVVFSPVEALFLVETDRLKVFVGKKEYSFEDLYKKFLRLDKQLAVRYPVYKDLRSKGYVVRTALKFGGDFRVYDKGIKPGEDHAKWIVYPVHEREQYRWSDLTAKNRVSHSTRKRLLLGIVDDELDVTYFEIAWKKP
jgi:tRNA-intron endonuclease